MLSFSTEWEKMCACAQELRELNLSETPVGDEDLRALRALPGLTALRLNRQPARHDVSNAGLGELAQLPRLARLELQGNCAVTARGAPCAVALRQTPFWHLVPDVTYAMGAQPAIQPSNPGPRMPLILSSIARFMLLLHM